MLSGRYPSDEFAELRPRLTWDRVAEHAHDAARAQCGSPSPTRARFRIAACTASSSPGAKPGAARVGELDEEMVFESRVGETFRARRVHLAHRGDHARPRARVAGAGRAGQDAVLERRHGRAGRASSAWRSDSWCASCAAAAGRRRSTASSGSTISIAPPPRTCSSTSPTRRAATSAVPDDRTIVIERCRDELGDWRVCVLSPLGGRVLIPWCLAVVARFRERARHRRRDDVERRRVRGALAGHGRRRRTPRCSCRPPTRSRRWSCGSSARAPCSPRRFREVAGRALLLPRRRRGARTPLWQQRKRAADLLAVAARYGSFPARARDLPRVPARRLRHAGARGHPAPASARRDIRVVDRGLAARPRRSPSSLLFSYVAKFLYDGDAPLAERRAQALSVDHAQLRELLGDAELRELLDASRARRRSSSSCSTRCAITTRESADGLHDLLLRIGDLSREEIAARAGNAGVERRDRRAGRGAAGDSGRRSPASRGTSRSRMRRGIAMRSGRRCRQGSPSSCCSRCAIPSAIWCSATRARMGRSRRRLRRAGSASAWQSPRCSRGSLSARTAWSQGEFRPGGREREWCGTEVLRTLRQRSLARLRKQVEPVDRAALGRFTLTWQGIARRRRGGLDALLDAIERCRARRCPRPSSSARSSRRASRAIAPATSICSSRRARSSGPASSRSAIETAGSRCS